MDGDVGLLGPKSILLKKQQDLIFHELASLLSALNSPVRLRIIHFLSQGPHPVELLAKKLDQTIANTSMHLRKMYNEGLLKIEGRGQQRFYEIANDALRQFWENIQDYAQLNNPSLKLKNELSDIIEWTFSFKDTLKFLKNGKAVLCDARPIEEINLTKTMPDWYITYHPTFGDKQSILSHKKRLSQKLKGKMVLVFCRGRFCVMSFQFAENLIKNGIRAYRCPWSWYQIEQMINEK